MNTHAITGRQALEQTFVTHHAQLRGIVLGIVRKADLADEIMQDAYLKVAVCPHADIDKPYCYCCRVVRNLAMDHFRRHATESGCRIFDVDVEGLDRPGHLTPDRILSEKQMLEAVDRVLDTLPARTREAFELCRLEDMTQRDIGRNLGCSATLVNFMLKDVASALRPCRHFLDD
ncbi:MAG TPA: sigma-70 family RNA polymerase sigma factor [Oxalicibacterium sp.]